MSNPFGSIILTLDDITNIIHNRFEHFTDPRKGKNKMVVFKNCCRPS